MSTEREDQESKQEASRLLGDEYSSDHEDGNDSFNINNNIRNAPQQSGGSNGGRLNQSPIYPNVDQQQINNQFMEQLMYMQQQFVALQSGNRSTARSAIDPNSLFNGINSNSTLINPNSIAINANGININGASVSASL